MGIGEWDWYGWIDLGGFVVGKELMLHVPMPNSFAFSSAAAAAILAASRESVGRLFVTDMFADRRKKVLWKLPMDCSVASVDRGISLLQTVEVMSKLSDVDQL